MKFNTNAMPRQATGLKKSQGQWTVEMDELWSFVDQKKTKRWGWLALDVLTREIVGCHIGT